MNAPHHAGEDRSNRDRDVAVAVEPRGLRTFTPSLAVLAKSAGVFHWTPDGRRLYDFTSGVLVSNLGHNPVAWTRRFFTYMGWPTVGPPTAPEGFFPALPLTAYNAVTGIETEASKRLVNALRQSPGGARLDQ